MRFVAVALLVAVSSTPAADLSVIIKGLPDSRGHVLCAVYTKDTYLKSAPSNLQFKLKAQPPEMTYVFHDVPPGRYAVVAFQDANDNGKIDLNSTGVPTELAAFSNDAQGIGGPPKFEQAVIVIGTTNKVVVLTLN